LSTFYSGDEGRSLLEAIPPPRFPLGTGMGASYHALLATAPTLLAQQIAFQTVEASDLLFYGPDPLAAERTLLFVSQSGESAEVAPLADRLAANSALIAVTNASQSTLAHRATIVLPLLAGDETLVATKTYLNSLATLWLLTRRWAGQLDDSEAQQFSRLAQACAQLLDDAEHGAQRWIEVLGDAQHLLFLGHGPHAATARHAAMVVSEWTKLPALSASIGAYRHGPIESAGPNLGVVLFAPPGPGSASAQTLAEELHSYGAQVLLVEQGRARSVSQAAGSDAALPETLAPAIDSVAVQIFVEALARKRGVAPGFRHIAKVMRSL
jgi:glucosamine--fructose-6-phosphate aminotransferase (isomerizing)